MAGRSQDMWNVFPGSEDTFLDGKEFKAYTRTIRNYIYAADRPLSIREIHERLGPAARREWTMDALASIKDIEEVGLLPTRYQPQSRPIAGLHTDFNGKFKLTPPKPKEPFFIDELIVTRS
jgi:hypothetical protein